MEKYIPSDFLVKVPSSKIGTEPLAKRKKFNIFLKPDINLNPEIPREVTAMENSKNTFYNQSNHRDFYKYFLDYFETVNLGNSFPEPSLLDELLVKSPFSGDKNIPRVTLWFAVDHFQDEYQKLKERGVEFLYKPMRIKNGHAVEFRDRFGNRWGITDYPLKEAENNGLGAFKNP